MGKENANTIKCNLKLLGPLFAIEFMSDILVRYTMVSARIVLAREIAWNLYS